MREPRAQVWLVAMTIYMAECCCQAVPSPERQDAIRKSISKRLELDLPAAPTWQGLIIANDSEFGKCVLASYTVGDWVVTCDGEKLPRELYQVTDPVDNMFATSVSMIVPKLAIDRSYIELSYRGRLALRQLMDVQEVRDMEALGEICHVESMRCLRELRYPWRSMTWIVQRIQALVAAIPDSKHTNELRKLLSIAEETDKMVQAWTMAQNDSEHLARDKILMGPFSCVTMDMVRSTAQTFESFPANSLMVLLAHWDNRALTRMPARAMDGTYDGQLPIGSVIQYVAATMVGRPRVTKEEFEKYLMSKAAK